MLFLLRSIELCIRLCDGVNMIFQMKNSKGLTRQHPSMGRYVKFHRWFIVDAYQTLSTERRFKSSFLVRQ
jgi:hypothetical protein